jgi:hypothetical protein
MNQASPADRSQVLTQLVNAGRARKIETRRQQANDQVTDSFLQAGIRLLGQGLGLGLAGPPDEVFRKWLSINEVVRNAQAAGPLPSGRLPTKNMLIERWPAHDDYIQDLTSHILSLHHWAWQQDIMGESAELLTDQQGDLVDAIRIVCYSDLKSLIEDPVQRILPLLTVLIAKDASSRERRAEHYRKVREAWTELFEATFAVYGIRLRPGIDIREAADILTALADGLAMRATGDPDAQVIDRTGDSLLGRAAAMMLLAGIDPGDHLTLEQALRQAVERQNAG